MKRVYRVYWCRPTKRFKRDANKKRLQDERPEVYAAVESLMRRRYHPQLQVVKSERA
jgi:hypothetical protein